MAIYHLNIGHVSRSTGRSAVQNAAYITGSCLYETRRDLTANYENRKEDVVWSETFAPAWVGDEFRDIHIWDTIESFEDDYATERFPRGIIARDLYCDSARTAMTLVVALPRELPSDILIELMNEFAHLHFISKDLVVTCAIHDDEGNPHGHFLISRRSLVRKNDGSTTFSWLKNRDMCTTKDLRLTRKLFADLTNVYLEREGFEERITEKSYAALGVNLTPTKHRGWVSDKLEAMGIQSRIVNENNDITEENKNKIIQNPEILLHELTSKQATFTQLQLLKTIQKRLGDDDTCNANVFEHILEKSIYLGDGIDGMSRYTSAHYQMKEKTAMKTLDSILAENKSHAVQNIRVDAYLSDHYAHMTDEQRQATLGLIQNDSLTVLLGRAGTGKTSTTVKAVCELYKQEGYTVIGGSLAQLAADNLGSETAIQTKTLHAWLYCWDRFLQAEHEFLSFNSIVSEGMLKQFQWVKDLKSFEPLQLHSKTVFVVDEAGMIGTDLWKRLLDHVRVRGAKVIAVGDDNQSKAIGAGDFFREIITQTRDKGCLFSLTKIQRQKIDWMRTASEQFATLNTQKGLALYEEKGHVHSIDSAYLDEEIAQHYVNRLASKELDDKGNPNYQTGLVLAFTNAQTKALNQAIRQKLRSTVIPGHSLSDFDALTLGKGEQATKFALGDKIVFLKNDNQHITLVDNHGEVITHRSISNGTTGILEKVKDNGKEIMVRIDATTTAHVDIDNYKDFNHGYALTIHKSQGQTVDFTVVAASRLMDARLTYVAMTRHRHDVHLFYSKEDFARYKEFALHMSRYTNKDLVNDYTIRPEHRDAWHRVHAYQQCIYDAASMMKESITEHNPDWKAYLDTKQAHIQLGKEILGDFDAHQTYLHQAGLTYEMLHYTTGQKLRPLSIAEQKAKLNVEIYGETARVARELWDEIKRSTHKKEHPLYEAYQNLRAERDALAKDILDNYPLYREFVNHYSKEYGMSKRTLENQVSYREKARQKQLLSEIKGSFNFKTSRESLTNKQPTDAKDHEIEHMLSGQKQQNTIPSSQLTSFEKSTTEISNELRAHIADLAIHFLGQPKQKSDFQWRYGTKGSIAIHVQGSKKGLYTNFESGVSGNAVSLIADQLNVSKKEAFKWGVNWLGYGHSRESMFVRNDSIHPKTDQQSAMSWKPIFPAPHDVPDLKNTPSTAYMMRGKVEVARYPYKNADSSILGYVIRLEDKNGQKITPTLTYCHNEHGQQMWRWHGFGDDRPLYGLEHLNDKPHAPVLIVEGEKTCEAARMLFPDHVVITWSGGCGSVYKTDWSPLTGKDVILFPDHDEAGLKAMLKIGDLLNKQGNQSIHIIDIPSTLPHKWDLADAMPAHITLADLMFQTKTYSEMAFEQYQKEHASRNKHFTDHDLQSCAQAHGFSFTDMEEQFPIMRYLADEAYALYENMYQLHRPPVDHAFLEQKALLTGLYGAWIQVMVNTHDQDPSFIDTMLVTGCLAAEARLTNKTCSSERTRLFDAYRDANTINQRIHTHLDNPPDAIKGISKEIQESMIRANYLCKAVTGKPMPASMNQKILTSLTHDARHLTRPEDVQAVINHVIHQTTRKEHTHPLTIEHLSFKVKLKQIHLQTALQQTHEKTMQIAHQQNLEKEHHRGHERSL